MPVSGPLIAGQTHKQEVMNFCQQKIRRAAEDPYINDRQSYILLWELLLLMLRQNGTIYGSDIAELLLKDEPSPSKSQVRHVYVLKMMEVEE